MSSVRTLAPESTKLLVRRINHAVANRGVQLTAREIKGLNNYVQTRKRDLYYIRGKCIVSFTLNLLMVHVESTGEDLFLSSGFQQIEIGGQSALTGGAQRVALPDFPRLWTMFGFLLPRKVRQEVFEPAQEEMKEDFLAARRRVRTRGERRWITFCFTLRSATLVGQSLGAWIGDRITRIISRIFRGVGWAILVAIFGDAAVWAFFRFFK